MTPRDMREKASALRRGNKEDLADVWEQIADTHEFIENLDTIQKRFINEYRILVNTLKKASAEHRARQGTPKLIHRTQ